MQEPVTIKKNIYNYLSGQNIANFPQDFDSFSQKFDSDPAIRQNVYNFLSKQNVANFPQTYEEFESTLTIKKKTISGQDSGTGLPENAAVPAETALGGTPQEAPPVQQTPPFTEQEQEEKVNKSSGIADKITNFLGGLNRGLLELAPSALQALGIGAAQIDKVIPGADTPASEQPLYKAGEWLRKQIEAVAPVNDPEAVETMVGNAFGQVGSMMAGGAIPKALSRADKIVKGETLIRHIANQAARPETLVAFNQILTSEFNNALAEGATDDEAFQQGIINAVAGNALEYAPIANVLKIANKSTKGMLARTLVSGATGGVQEAITEAFQSFMSNATANEIYDAQRELTQGVFESGGTGGFVGTVLGTFASLVGGRRAVTKSKADQQRLQDAEDELNQAIETTKNQDELPDEKKADMEMSQTASQATEGLDPELDTQAEAIIRSVAGEGKKPVYRIGDFNIDNPSIVRKKISEAKSLEDLEGITIENSPSLEEELKTKYDELYAEAEKEFIQRQKEKDKAEKAKKEGKPVKKDPKFPNPGVVVDESEGRVGVTREGGMPEQKQENLPAKIEYTTENKQQVEKDLSTKIVALQGKKSTPKEKFEFLESLPDGTIISHEGDERIVFRQAETSKRGSKEFVLTPQIYNEETGQWEDNNPGLTIVKRDRHGRYWGEFPAVMGINVWTDFDGNRQEKLPTIILPDVSSNKSEETGRVGVGRKEEPEEVSPISDFLKSPKNVSPEAKGIREKINKIDEYYQNQAQKHGWDEQTLQQYIDKDQERKELVRKEAQYLASAYINTTGQKDIKGKKLDELIGSIERETDKRPEAKIQEQSTSQPEVEPQPIQEDVQQQEIQQTPQTPASNEETQEAGQEEVLADTDADTPPPTEPPAEQTVGVTKPSPNLTGIKLSLLSDEKIKSVKVNKRTDDEIWNRGVEMVDNGEIDPRRLIEETLETNRALQPEETAATIYYRAQLGNEFNQLYDAKVKAEERGDMDKVAKIQTELDALELQIDKFEVFSRQTGYEQGQGLRVRKFLVNNVYDLEHVFRRYKKINLGVLPKDVEQRFQEYDEQLKALNKQIEEYQKEEKERLEQSVIEEIEKELTVTETGVKVKRGRELISEGVDDLIKALSGKSEGGVLYSSALPISPEVVKAFVKIGKGLIQEGTATIKNVIEKIQDQVDTKFKGKINVSEHKDKILESLQSERGKAKFEKGKLVIPRKLIREHVSEGKKDIESLTKAIHNEVIEEFPDVTERQVRDAISEYGKPRKLSKDEINRNIREIKRIGRLVSSLEDVRSGKRPAKTIIEKDSPSQKEVKLREQLEEAKKFLPEDKAEVERVQKATLEGIKKRLRKRIDELEQQLKTGQKPDKRGGIEYDAEAKALKAHLEGLKAIIKHTENTKTPEERRIENAIRAAEESTREYERRIKEKDFTPAPKKQKPEPPELKNAREKRDEARKKYEDAKKQATQGKKKSPEEIATKRALDSAEKELKRIQDRISRKELKDEKRESKVQETAELKAARKRLEDAKEVLRGMQEEAGIGEQKRLEAYKERLKKETQKYEERIRNKDYIRHGQRPPKRDREAIRLEVERNKIKEKFDLEFEKARRANRSRSERFKEGFIDYFNLPKSLVTTADLSAPLRQGAILSAGNPRAAAKAFKDMFVHAFSKKKSEDWLHYLKASNEFSLMNQAGLYISQPTAKLAAKEEQFMTNIAHRIPIWKYVVGASERAYVGYLNTLRAEVFNKGADVLIDRGFTPHKNPEAFQAWAKFVNNATGRGSLGRFEGRPAEVLNAAFFSPRYLTSRIQLLNPREYYKMPAPVRQMALKNMAAYMGIVGLITALVSLNDDVEVSLDPTSSDFMKWRIGDLRFDPWGGFQQIATTIAKSIEQVVGSVKQIVTGEKSEESVFSKKNAVAQYFLYKLSPSASLGFELLSGETVLGEDLTVKNTVIDRVAPLYVQDVYEIAQQEGIGYAVGAGVPSFFGLGVQYYKREQKSEIQKRIEREKARLRRKAGLTN